jgi:hypothetical protein
MRVQPQKLDAISFAGHRSAGAGAGPAADREQVARGICAGKGRAICINLGDGLTQLQEVQLNGFDSTRIIRRSCAAVLP